MPPFTTNAQRFEPYKNFKFRVKWEGRYVAGVSKVGALKRTTEVVKHREGGDPSTSRKSPGRTEYEAISLERGITHDVDFEQWANKVWNYGNGLGQEVSLKDFRKDIIIEMYNEAGQLVIAYKVYRCWPSEYQAQPDLDANANAVAIQHLKLENEGWERDYEVKEPQEPTFVEPVVVGDIEARLPRGEDITAVMHLHEPDAIRRALLERCTGAPVPPDLMDQIEDALAAADPRADVQLALTCPACGHEWLLRFDAAAFFWSELSAAAERVLGEVDTLARAYGWSEREILSMSARRRALYVERLSS